MRILRLRSGQGYRNDPAQKRKYKTVELIEEESHWKPDLQRIAGNKLVYVRIKYEETYLRKVIKSAGGRWNKDKKLWELPYAEVKQLGFTSRMVPDGRKELQLLGTFE